LEKGQNPIVSEGEQYVSLSVDKEVVLSRASQWLAEHQ
jgi:hypothetical protein